MLVRAVVGGLDIESMCCLEDGLSDEFPRVFINQPIKHACAVLTHINDAPPPQLG